MIATAEAADTVQQQQRRKPDRKDSQQTKAGYPCNLEQESYHQATAPTTWTLYFSQGLPFLLALEGVPQLCAHFLRRCDQRKPNSRRSWRVGTSGFSPKETQTHAPTISAWKL
jgi:hypothetical protein